MKYLVTLVMPVTATTGHIFRRKQEPLLTARREVILDRLPCRGELFDVPGALKPMRVARVSASADSGAVSVHLQPLPLKVKYCAAHRQRGVVELELSQRGWTEFQWDGV